MPVSLEKLRIHKFGGAAVADASAIRHACGVVTQASRAPAVVVVSALHGVTDALLRTAALAAEGDREGALAGAERLRSLHREVALALAVDGAGIAEAIDGILDEVAGTLSAMAAAAVPDPVRQDEVAAAGERLSARILAAALGAEGVAAQAVEATEVVHATGVPGNAFPDLEATARAAQDVLLPLLRQQVIPVVPGFIGRGPDGALVTLGRGGTDLTATTLGSVLRAREVVLWKDVPGFLTADPRVVPDARVIPRLHPREAAELAHHGAKVLHPRAVTPLLSTGTRLFVRPFADPQARGTEISVQGNSRRDGGAPEGRYPVKALAALTGQTLVTVRGSDTVRSTGLLARAFAVLDEAGVAASFIAQASAEPVVSFAVPTAVAADLEARLLAAFSEEMARGQVEGVALRSGLATVAVVGLGVAGGARVVSRVFSVLADAEVGIAALARGASETNLSVVVDEADAVAMQRTLHAAFRLEKIGGGLAETPRHADIVLLGVGKVGRELALQIAARGRAGGIRLVGMIDREGFVFEPGGLSPQRLRALVRGKAGGAGLASLAGGRPAPVPEALRFIVQHALSRPILVDLTAGDTRAVLNEAVVHGMDLVLANKRPLAEGDAGSANLVELAASRGRRVLHEATVGAGLPVIDTVRKLVESGDRVLRIEGCPSGTLGFLFGELGRGTPFSQALRQAMALGYTEPDPRDDLSGMDVARKAVILGRLLGFTGGLDAVSIESLVPEALRDVPLPEFLDRLEELDPAWERRVSRAREQGRVLRYRVIVTARRVRVGIVAVTPANPLAALRGTDNQFSFTTRRYRQNPLVITGPGAGPSVTAAGVLNDVLALAATHPAAHAERPVSAPPALRRSASRGRSPARSTTASGES